MLCVFADRLDKHSGDVALTDTSIRKIHRALVSVSDKSGLSDFVRRLEGHGIEVLSTGGTSKLLRADGLAVRDVADLTGFPEMLDGRVKTLHPKVHGGILGIRSDEIHLKQMTEHGIEPIDLVVVNLYPFEKTVAKPGVERNEAIENIDIGGPAMIRSAAKNHTDVAVVVDVEDYSKVADELDRLNGSLSLELRSELALKAFRHTSAYDRAISRYLAGDAEKDLPDRFDLTLEKVQALRYGENPHQRAALYRIANLKETGVSQAEKLQGKELSYNNLLDSDAAWDLLCDLQALEPTLVTCVIIKHTNPCGVGVADTPLAAFQAAKATDPVSAFGGIIAFSQEIDRDTAEAIAELFAEVIIVPGLSADASEVLSARKNLRVLRISGSESSTRVDLRRISGGILVQDHDQQVIDQESLKVVTERAPTDDERKALEFAWVICKHVKSNAIVYARRGQLVGVGAGQMSRVDSVKLGALKAQLPLDGCVLASDAFFPFRDGLDEAAKHGITAVIQPGGSVRDKEVIEAANEHGITMVLTGMRHFRH